MMGKTHVAMGMATSMMVLNPTSPKLCLFALAGGAVGGVVADIDTVKNDYKHDALIGQCIAYGTLLICLGIDFFNNYGMCDGFIKRNMKINILGIIIYLMLICGGVESKHRTFTHSLLALCLFSNAVCILFPQIVGSFIIGYLSHLILDITNKKPVPLFYPKGKGICLEWFYAGKIADKIFMVIGIVITLTLVVNVFMPIG